MRHRLVRVSRSPHYLEEAYGCICGVRGTREEIERHVTANTTPAGFIDDPTRDERRAWLPKSRRVIEPLMDIDLGGDTKVDYEPNEPRRPATPAQIIEDLPPSPSQEPSIAEAFQNMLRVTFYAGVAAAASGEAFEDWYQREILR
jgi:hypothetical protein